MTKTLTEQYYDQTLEDGFYYAKDKTFKNVFILEWNEWGQQYQDCEIICKVPFYDEYQKLQKKLEIAKEALEYYADENNYCQWALDEDGDLPNEAQQALKEMEGVK